MLTSSLQILKLKLFTNELQNFFVNLIKETIRVRETQGVIRPDMINQLLEARKGGRYIDPAENEGIDAGFTTVQESATNLTDKSVKMELTNLDTYNSSGASILFRWFRYRSYIDVFLRLRISSKS